MYDIQITKEYVIDGLYLQCIVFLHDMCGGREIETKMMWVYLPKCWRNYF